MRSMKHQLVERYNNAASERYHSGLERRLLYPAT